MEKIPTADEFIGQWLIENTGIKGEAKDAYWNLHHLFDAPVAKRYITRAMKAYANLHAQAALETAYRKHWNMLHDSDDILNAYPPENIK